MTILQLVALAVVATGGAAVVLVKDPLRQTMVLGIYSLALMFLFFVFQSPDVALSEIVVGSVGMPLIILATLRIISERRAVREEQEDEG